MIDNSRSNGVWGSLQAGYRGPEHCPSPLDVSIRVQPTELTPARADFQRFLRGEPVTA
jgi:hypothetical protein